MTTPTPAPEPPSYLAPYLRAAQRHGDAFPTLLWATPATQRARFDAISRLHPLDDKLLLDVGCGRADFLDFLHSERIRPRHYVGIEAVPELAAAAGGKRHADCIIVRADFIREPVRMLVGADAVVFSGSLNTADADTFYRTLRTAYEAATEVMIFNFLSSPNLAAANYLTWHEPADVLAFARSLSPHTRLLDDYLDGDTTIAVYRGT